MWRELHARTCDVWGTISQLIHCDQSLCDSTSLDRFYVRLVNVSSYLAKTNQARSFTSRQLGIGAVLSGPRRARKMPIATSGKNRANGANVGSLCQGSDIPATAVTQSSVEVLVGNPQLPHVLALTIVGDSMYHIAARKSCMNYLQDNGQRTMLVNDFRSNKYTRESRLNSSVSRNALGMPATLSQHR